MTVINPATGTEWTPEFEGQRPPFQPGNQLAVKHGAFSDRQMQPIARAHYERMLADPTLPALLRASYMQDGLQRFCEAMARRDLLADWVDAMSIQDAADSDRGKTSPLELLRKWETTVDNKAKDWGLTPASYVRIHRDSAMANQADAATLLTRARAEAEANTSST